MVKLADRVKFSTSTVGTGTITVGPAAEGYQLPADAGILNADTVRYVIEDGAAWEIGTGTYTSGSPSMSRSVIESSLGASPISLSGNAVVFLSVSSSDLQFAADMDQDLRTTTTPTFAGMNLSALTLDGAPITATGTEINVLAGVTASTAELNILDGVTASTAELNLLDGVTTSTAELNLLDGVTASTAELNLLDGVTWTPTNFNSLTATVAELNYLDIATLGTSAASKAVTADANGVVTFSDGVNEGFTAVTSSGGTATIDCRIATVFSITLSENTTFTFSNPPSSGTAYGFTLKLVQDSTARTVTWPASVDWELGATPAISSGSGGVDVFVFITHDAGTTWYGFVGARGLS